MSVLQLGTIVFVRAVMPPNGDKSSAKDRRVLVVEPANDSNPKARCVVIATLRNTRHDPTREVIIPHRNDGHPRTTLTQPSVAVCDWVIEVSDDEILPERRRGRCQQDMTNEVIRTISLLLEETNESLE